MALDDPQLAALRLDIETPFCVASWLGDGTERPGTRVDPPWRASPEGLTVFLI